MPANPASAAARTASRTRAHGASNGSSRRSTSTSSALRNRVPGFDVADRLHVQLPCARSLALSVMGGEQECDVVAGVGALDDRAGEPVTAGEHGTAVGARTPFDVL